MLGFLPARRARGVVIFRAQLLAARTQQRKAGVELTCLAAAQLIASIGNEGSR